MRGFSYLDFTAINVDRYRDPLQALQRLLKNLVIRGEPRKAAEPLELYASRLFASQRLGASGSQAGTLLNRYIAWRYGDHGDKNTISRTIDDWLKQKE